MSNYVYDAKRLMKLLDREMRSKTKKEFARQCGITPESFSRFTRRNNPIRPGEITLRKIAANTDLDLDELKRACGYITSDNLPMDAPKKRAESSINDIRLGFDEMTKNIRLYQDIQSFLEEFDMIYSRETAKVTYAVGNKEEYYGEKNGEYFSPICMVFKALKGTFRIFAVLYYCETKGGKIIVTDFDVTGSSLLDAGVITPEVQDMLYEQGQNVEELPFYYTFQRAKPSVENLLDILFNTEMIEYPTTVSGFGFALTEDVDCSSFLKKHKDSFCIGKTEQALYERFVSGKDPVEIFKDYKAPYTEHTGIGAMVAKVMCEETDIQFEWWVGEKESASCVLYTGDDYTTDELKSIVYPYAKELGLDRYGFCYVLTHDYLDKSQIFMIDKEGN